MTSTGAAGQAPRRPSQPDMPNITAVLKDEIARIAHKEVRAQTEDFKKVSARYRSHIAALRKRVDELERQVRRAGQPARTPLPRRRKSRKARRAASAPPRLAGQRSKLGLSAADFGALLPVFPASPSTSGSIARPGRARQLEAIAARCEASASGKPRRGLDGTHRGGGG